MEAFRFECLLELSDAEKKAGLKMMWICKHCLGRWSV